MTVDLAGPPSRDDSISISPMDLRRIADTVVTDCVTNVYEAGFGTQGLQKTAYGMETRKAGGFGMLLQFFLSADTLECKRFLDKTRLMQSILDAPLFLTVSLGPPNVPNYRPGDTDPEIALALRHPLSDRRHYAVLQSTRNKVSVFMNELGVVAMKMMQGGKKAWWDTGKFQAVILASLEYQCKEVLGPKGALQARDCQDASYAFVQQGAEARITFNNPIIYTRGEDSTTEYAIV